MAALPPGDDSPYDELPSTVDPSTASTSTQALPKKGILKRAASQGTYSRDAIEERDRLFPLRQFRHSPDRFPEKPATRIPKLSLTWSEKNAVAFFGDTTSDENTTENEEINVPTLAPFTSRIPVNPNLAGSVRQTAILHDDDDESEIELHDERTLGDEEADELSEVDDRSVTSSNGSSHISGKWWFGKSTKFIPHCAKRGCTHLHADCAGGDYLTPTQRRTKEIHQLRKQLKIAMSQLEDKEAHLNELRERLNELEVMVDSSNMLSESHKLMAKQREQLIKSHDQEKQFLIEKHEIRVRQLIQEAVDARAEMMKLSLALKEIKERKKNCCDKETMTEILEMTPDAPTPRINPEAHPQMSASFPPSPQVERNLQPTIAQIPQDIFLQLQAYQNEALVWRTKAAQLEIVLKEQIVKSQQIDTIGELDRYKAENEKLKHYVQQLESHSQTMVDSGIEANISTLSPEHRPSLPEQRSVTSTECFSPLCVDKRKQLVSENNQLHEKIEEQSVRIQDLEEDVSVLRKTVDSLEEDSVKSANAIKQLSEDLERTTAEVQAANLTNVRLQNEIAVKTKAICYLEERHQAYRNVILDNDLVVSDESTEDWRRGFSDPRYIVNLSKKVQTDLTSEALSHSEKDFHSLRDKLKELEHEFSSKHSDMHGRFREIEQNLIMKTNLVEALTHQLEEADKEALSSTQRHQKEREAFQAKINELGRIAERVPLLEFEIEKLQQERSALQLKAKTAQEEFDAGLEVALAESLKKYRQQSTYWTEKLKAVNAQSESHKAQVLALERELENLRLRSKVEKADMSQRLTSSIDHVTVLKSQIDKSTRDVEVDAHPRVVSKYVACRPNARHKSTDIAHGDLFDEVEERLKLCQGELNITRRQVEILQQKLLDTVQIQAEDRLITHTPIPPIRIIDEETTKSVESETRNKEGELKELTEKLQELESRNADLSIAIKRVEEEKENMAHTQRQQIAHLVIEFDNVRKELDQEMSRYENERCRLKNRVEVLEKAKLERDRLLESLRAVEGAAGSAPMFSVVSTAPLIREPSEQRGTGTGDESPDVEKLALMKRCVSVPYLRAPTTPGDELSVLRERNSVLAQANARLTKELALLKESIESSIRRTVSRVSDVASHTNKSPSSRSELSPCFGDLATDLNQVRVDLENILVQIDKSSDGRQRLTVSPEISSSSSLKVDKASCSSDNDFERLKRALRRSRAEREALREQLDRVTLNLQDACRELDLYKHEPREEALKYIHSPRIPRSRSFVELGRATIDLDEHVRWKDKAGTMFRELNRVREEHRVCDAERRDLRLQLIMMRGELGLAQCQIAELTTRPQKNSAENAMSQSTFIPERESRRSCITRQSKIHESSGIYAMTHASFYSLDDITFVSEPDLSSTSRPETKDRFYSPSRVRESKKYSTKEEGNRRYAEEHDEIIKEAAKVQIASLRRENEALRMEIDAQCFKKISDKEEQLTVASKANEELRKEIRNVRTKLAAENEKKITDLSKWNEALKEELQLTHLELDSLKTSTETRISAYELREAEDKKKISTLLEENESIKEENKKLRDNEAVQRLSFESRISMLSRENEIFMKKMDEMEKERQEMYLVMFKKGQQAAEHDIQEVKAVDELTEDRIVLRFLHDAFYYFLLNKGDSREHLQAIMTMLNFSRQQKEDVYRRRGASH